MSNTSTMRAHIAETLKRRHRSERRFRLFGLLATMFGLAFLAVLFVSITSKGYTAFQKTSVLLEVRVDAGKFDPSRPVFPEALGAIDFQGLIKQSLRQIFPEAKKRLAKRELYRLVSSGAAYELRDRVLKKPDIVGTTVSLWVTASDDVDMVTKGVIAWDAEPAVRRLSDRQMGWLDALKDTGRLETGFNWTLFTSGDSREPELSGVAVAIMGSLYSVLVCLALAFPLGVMTAVYLEEFAPRNRWIEFLEININNLAAVPSIVFGLLGLAVFLNVFHLPRSSPVVGGLVLALMTLPTIIIASRAALKAVPPSVRDAALAVGASPVQAVIHHVLPLALPGTLTGTVIGTARALGETAPLLMVGMVAFIVDLPETIMSPATALPVQVFLWADQPERAFGERTAAAILILLVFVCLMNLLAVALRRRFEIRW